MRKTAFCICENKGGDQLCGIRAADQRLCFHHVDGTMPPRPNYDILSLNLSSLIVLKARFVSDWGFVAPRLDNKMDIIVTFHFHHDYTPM